MTHLLDSNVCIAHMRQKSRAVIARFAAHLPTDLAVCSVVVAELWYGIGRSARPAAEAAKVATFLRPYLSLPFDDAAAARYVDARLALEAAGTRLDDADLMIAAVALAHNLTLVTHNTQHLNRVPGLRVEDWQGP